MTTAGFLSDVIQSKLAKQKQKKYNKKKKVIYETVLMKIPFKSNVMVQNKKK